MFSKVDTRAAFVAWFLPAPLVTLTEAGCSSGLRPLAEHELISLLVLNGLRLSEATGADIEQLGLERGHRMLTITRKGGKVVTIPLAPRTARAIDLAVAERTGGPVFLAADGRRLDRHGAGRIVGRIARQAGIGKAVTPYKLRHAFITAALDVGVPLRDVQEAASHADPRTTMRYERARGSLDRHATYIVAARSRRFGRSPAREQSGTAMSSAKEELFMSTENKTLAEGGTSAYVTRFDGVRVPATDYQPVWVASLANDVTIEGSAMNGVVQGAEAVRSIVTYIRTLYDDQEFHFAGPYGRNGFLEDYTARVRGEQLGNVVLVTRNAAGQAQHIVANYRPRTTLLLVSRLVGEHFSGTPYGEHFASSAPE